MTGDTLEALKTEIEEDLGKNITEQEERITTNSDLISTVTDEVAKNKVDVRSFETRLNEQKRETTDLINGVFSNLSGVLASAVQNVVRPNEAEVARLKQTEAADSRTRWKDQGGLGRTQDRNDEEDGRDVCRAEREDSSTEQ